VRDRDREGGRERERDRGREAKREGERDLSSGEVNESRHSNSLPEESVEDERRDDEVGNGVR
jgi:hypothetical protein